MVINNNVKRLFLSFVGDRVDTHKKRALSSSRRSLVKNLRCGEETFLIKILETNDSGSRSS